MRLIVRFALLTVLALGSSSLLLAEHLTADCPLTFVGAASPSTAFGLGPHGIFRNGSLLYVLRGNTLTTLNITDVGDISLARPEDPIPTMGREREGGVAYNAGFLYVGTESGLEVYDLRTTRGGPEGTGPIFVNRIPGVHYRRLAASGAVLAGLFPASDLPCSPAESVGCRNTIDIYSLADPGNPVRVAQISQIAGQFAFEDIAFANGLLYVTGQRGTVGINVGNPALPVTAASNTAQGVFLATNGFNLLGIGQPTQINVFNIFPGPGMVLTAVAAMPSIMDRANDLQFHREAWFEGPRLITMIDEVDPFAEPMIGFTGRSARTIAFDVFDLTIPFFEGSDDRIYENVSFTFPDEIKHDPFAIGPFVYVVGEISGVQKYGACGEIAGRIEFDTVSSLPCGGAELHGWVTGANRISTVEVYLNGTLLGNATLGRPRTEIPTPNTAVSWRIAVNLDQTAAGLRTLRAVGTDILGNRRQFASVQVNFPGPPNNCVSRRRLTKR